jgi:predicted dehydrogenase
MGTRRAATAFENQRSQLVAVVDSELSRSQALAQQYGCQALSDWRLVASDPNVDAAVVSTVNQQLAPITIGLLAAGKHVLCEKPLGRNGTEASSMLAAARERGLVLKVGFNLRFHPAIRTAKQRCGAGHVGPLFFLRAIYGHGGRPGYAGEWRGNADLAGGGELLDQGVHVLDLARWFLGEPARVIGMTSRLFWPIEPLEDNAFFMVRTEQGQTGMLHTSWTQWRNKFLLEIYGRDGYLKIDGLGGNYGTETLTVGRRDPRSLPPVEEVLVFDGPDNSWRDDWADFVDAIETGRRPEVDGADGVAVMRLVDEIYAAARDFDSTSNKRSSG